MPEHWRSAYTGGRAALCRLMKPCYQWTYRHACFFPCRPTLREDDLQMLRGTYRHAWFPHADAQGDLQARLFFLCSTPPRPPEEPGHRQLREGGTSEVTGLVNNSELNGETVTTVCPIPDTERWKCVTTEGEEKTFARLSLSLPE